MLGNEAWRRSALQWKAFFMSLVVTRKPGQAVIVKVPAGTKIPPEGIQIVIAPAQVRGQTVRLAIEAPKGITISRDDSVKDQAGEVIKEPHYRRGICSVCNRAGLLTRFQSGSDLSDRWICAKEACISLLRTPEAAKQV